MSAVIQIERLGGLESLPSELEGSYVKTYDPNGHDGHGDLTTTFNLAEAKRFDDGAQAMTFYRQISDTHPLRPDGRPNRPLTAFTVCIKNLGE